MNDASKAFEKAINRHGFGFQYSVLKALGQLANERKSLWRFQVAEFPVAAQGRNTHIDFVLTLGSNEWAVSVLRDIETPVYLIAECKRADPAISNWCFARSGYTRRNPRSYEFIAEHAIVDKESGTPEFRSSGVIGNIGLQPFDIGLEVRSNELGDGSGSGGRGALQEALSQAFLGMNGMVEHFHRQFDDGAMIHEKGAMLIPVLFTTARLFVCELNLCDADLANGKISMESTELSEEPWVLYQYNGSVGLKHSHKMRAKSRRLSDVISSEFVRTIPIVSASGLEQFVTSFGVEVADFRVCP